MMNERDCLKVNFVCKSCCFYPRIRDITLVAEASNPAQNANNNQNLLQAGGSTANLSLGVGSIVFYLF